MNVGLPSSWNEATIENGAMLGRLGGDEQMLRVIRFSLLLTLVFLLFILGIALAPTSLAQEWEFQVRTHTDPQSGGFVGSRWLGDQEFCRVFDLAGQE